MNVIQFVTVNVLVPERVRIYSRNHITNYSSLNLIRAIKLSMPARYNRIYRFIDVSCSCEYIILGSVTSGSLLRRPPAIMAWFVLRLRRRRSTNTESSWECNV